MSCQKPKYFEIITGGGGHQGPTQNKTHINIEIQGLWPPYHIQHHCYDTFKNIWEGNNLSENYSKGLQNIFLGWLVSSRHVLDVATSPPVQIIKHLKLFQINYG